MSMARYTSLTSDKNKDTTLILCIFGGAFGLHQFYVGNLGNGLLYLFTVGFFCFGWIGDIIKILLGSFRDNAGMPLTATRGQNNEIPEVRVVNQETVYNSIRQEDNITQIERLAKLKDQGIITQEEFDTKKKELLK